MIHIRPARKRDYPRIIALSDIAFGQGYLTKKTVKEPDQTYVFWLEDDLVGFASWSMWEPYDQNEHDLILGYVESVGVHPDARGMGIARMLVQACVMDMWEFGANLIECTAAVWSDQGINLRPPLATALEKNGFKFVRLLDKHWKDEPENPNYQCRACGYPCQCDAWLFRLNRKHHHGREKAHADGQQ